MSDAGEIDRICDRFEADWKAGVRPPIESYLREAPEARRPDLLRELLGLEFEYRLRSGERPQLAEYQQRFPDHRDMVQIVFSKPVPAAAATPPSRTDAGAWRLILTATEGPHKGEVFPFVGHDLFLVGRSKQAHLQLRDNYFSRSHFIIEANPPRCRLMDMGSRNGTFLNGERIQSAELHHGDTIKAGNTTLEVAISAPEAAPTGGLGDLDMPTLDMPGGPRPAAALPPGSLAETITYANVPAAPSTRFTPNKAGGAPAIPAAPLSTVAPPADVLPVIPGYKLIRELGRGGMGVVYLAEDKEGKRAALKTIIPAVASSRNQVDRFLREAKILRELQHHHIVAFREVDEAAGVLYFAMEYIEGPDAAQLLKQKKGPLGVRDAVRIVSQMLSALYYAHGKGFVHRDIKPGNILLSEEGNRKVVKLADFGLARVYQQSRLSGLTMMGEVGGTMAFMPPEQITQFRQVKPAADQYSAAATLYTLLTGRLIFDFEGVPVEHQFPKVLDQEPVPIRQRRPEVPEPLAAAIHRALAKDPEARFPNVKAFLSPLLPYAH